MASKNENLHKAKKAKNDEFYTRIEDIENELVNYKDFFKDKVVYCNCDHPTESNFPRYFLLNFEKLGLKKLVSTCFINDGKGWIGTKEKDGEYTIEQLEGNGDFRSEECIEFLKQADVVVTNPPFSLFREYMKQLIDYGKKFLIIGNGNAVTYKDVMSKIISNEIRIGVSKGVGGHFWMIANKEFNVIDASTKQKDGHTLVDISLACWFTNMKNERGKEELELSATYTPTEYPKYDNYDAIEVGKVKDIPKDYYGVMGVPFSFMDKFCPAQFQILGVLNPKLKGKWKYKRMLIKRKITE
jgi:hypothetical protein